MNRIRKKILEQAKNKNKKCFENNKHTKWHTNYDR
jgi:hypothetical protein